jgi:hypothetical protein
MKHHDRMRLRTLIDAYAVATGGTVPTGELWPRDHPAAALLEDIYSLVEDSEQQRMIDALDRAFERMKQAAGAR